MLILKKRAFLCGIMLGLCLAVTHLEAQTSTGSVLGMVTDPSGAAIVSAVVTLESLDTGQTRTALTNEPGRYEFAAVLPGNYRMTIKKEGFTTTVIDHIQVLVNVAYTANAALQVGAVTEQVMVTAAAVQV